MDRYDDRSPILDAAAAKAMPEATGRAVPAIIDVIPNAGIMSAAQIKRFIDRLLVKSLG
jgi:hypothetical protein